MRYYHENRKQKRNREILQGCALIAGVIAIAIILFPVFDWIDCNTATRYADAHEACITDTTCTPTDRQTWTYDRERYRIIKCRQRD